MSEWHPEVVKIEKIEQHPNADMLEIAIVNSNYPCIIKKNQYKPNDIVGYIPVDSIVKDTEQFFFLCPKDKYTVGSVPEKYRIIKAKRLRGVFSIGLIVDAPEGFVEGQSIVEHFGLTKWEEEGEENIKEPGLSTKGGYTKSPPKGWSIPHYDLESLRKWSKVIEQFSNEEIVITEKLNGCNASFIHRDGEFWAKSRNLYKKDEGECLWWMVAKKYEFETKLVNYPNLAIFGEIYGQVGGYRYDRLNDIPNFRAFDVYDTASMTYLDYDKARTILDELNIPRVPELYRGSMINFDEVKKFSEGQSTLNQNHIREGCVMKPIQNKIIGRGDRFVLKLVSETYLLKK